MYRLSLYLGNCFKLAVITLFFWASPLNLYAQTVSTPDSSEASLLYDKGLLLIDEAKYDSASVLISQAAELYKTANQWTRVAAAYNHLSSNYRVLSRLDEASDYAQKTLEILEQKSLEAYAEQIKAYNNLGLIATERSEFKEAKSLFQNGLDLTPKPSVPVYIKAMLLANLGSVYDDEGEYEEALAYYEEGIGLLGKNQSDNHIKQLSKLYNYAGVTHVKKGLFDQALQFYERELELNLQLYGESHPSVAGGYNNIGGIYYRAGDVGEAIIYFKKSASSTQAVFGEKHPRVALIYNNIGACYYETGDYNKAVEYLEKSAQIKIETQGTDHPDLALTYNNIGSIHTEMDNYGEAIDYLERSLSIRKKVLGDRHPILSNNYNSLGLLYLNKEDAERAIAYFEMGLDIAIESRGRKHPYVAEARTNLAKAHRKRGDYYKALTSLREAEEDLKNRDRKNLSSINSELDIPYRHPVKVVDVLREKGKTLHMQYLQSRDIGVLKSALATYTRLSGLLDGIQLSFQNEDSKLLMGTESHGIYEEAIEISHLLYETTGNASYLNDIFLFAEKSKSRVILEQLNRQKGKKFAGVPDSLLDNETRLRQELSTVQQKLRSGDNADDEMLQDSLFILNRQLGEHIEILEQNYPRYHDFKYRSDVPALSRVKKSLSEKGLTLIEYFYGEESSWVILINGSSLEVITLPHIADISKKITTFNKAIAGQNNEDYVRLGYELYQALFEPVEKHLEGTAGSLLVVPDGALNLLPFNALLTKNVDETNAFTSLPYLLKRFSISYSPSVSLSSFFENRDRSTYQQKLIALAPVFSDSTLPALQQVSSRNSWQPLPSTKYEVEQIAESINKQRSFWASLFGSSSTKILTDHQATEASFKSESLNQYQYLHLATHAFTSGPNEGRAGIAFYPDEKGGEDGILYMEEIYALDLNNELVVLSACDTGTGEVQTGEGIIGLSRAFQYAGADNLLVSLWNVEDRSTARLMILFYEKLQEGLNPSEALRFAQKELLRSYTYAHPRYWAPFIYIGN